MNAVCIITRNPKQIWIDFLKTFTQFDVFIAIDDKGNYPANANIKYIQIDNQECLNEGFCHSSSDMGFNTVIAWDKALCYFSKNNIYNHVWFIEDDVFIYNEQTLLNLNKYDHDLLTRENNFGSLNNWHWNKVSKNIKLPTPWYNSMICACRMSSLMISKITEYVKTNHRLFFIEAMFTTLANHYQLKIYTPIELYGIHYNTKWNRDDIDIDMLYHPFKNLEDHVYIRNKEKNILTSHGLMRAT